MVLYSSQEFWKSVPVEKKKLVEKQVLRLRKELLKSNHGIFGTSLRSQTRMFQGLKNINLFKFRVNESDRIIFSYSDSIKGLRDDDEYGIYLHRYVSHDEQASVARRMTIAVRDEFVEVPDRQEFSESDIEVVDEGDIDFAHKAESYIDLEKVVTYLINVEEENGQEVLIKDARVDHQQYEYITDLSPMLVIGGAGSGKTLVTIHKARVYRGYENRVAYFTLSEHLRNSSEKIYKNMGYAENDVEFHSLKDYCLDQLYKDEKIYVGYERFNNEFFKNIGVRDLDAFDVWAEIRGLIKGYMGQEWFRPRSFAFNEYPGEIISFFKQNRLVAPVNGNERVLQSCLSNERELSDALEAIKSTADNSIDIDLLVESLKRVHQNNTGFRYMDSREKLIDESVYLGLDSQASIYDSDIRRKIYQIALKYQYWLDQEKLMDDNDLAGQLILKLYSRKQDDASYDYIVVDEVQDFTELQIYLFTFLVRSLDDITFAGDIHQIINPTYFQNDRLGKLYHLNGRDLAVNVLNKNYRSQKSIVDLANRLSEIRRKKIAKDKEVTEQLEIAVLDGNMPFYLNNTKENLRQSLQTLSQRANACIVIADEKDRRKLEAITGEQMVNVFTIQEVKGLEYEYVFCYNLASTYKEGWGDIFSDNARKNSKYRYYFNVFYVAITRAKENLCIFEDSAIFLNRDDLLSDFIFVDEFDEDRLGINGHLSSSEEWREMGCKMEESGRFDLAIRYYEKAKVKVDVLRCKARLEFEQGNYEYAIDELINLNEYRVAYDLALKIRDKSRMLVSRLMSGKADAEEIDREYGGKFVSKTLGPFLHQEEYGALLFENYVKQKMQITQDRIVEATAKLEGMVS